MSVNSKRHPDPDTEGMRFLGRGLRARRGVHLSLGALRQGSGKTQLDIADASGIDQADISRLENRTDLDECQVSTLRRYVAALGGELELVAAFGNKKFVLVGAHAASTGKAGD